MTCRAWANGILLGCLVIAHIGSVHAAPPHLVTDINAQWIPVNSYPVDFADQGSWSFLDANDGIDGSEPWVTNGTAAGTFLWGHVAPPGSGVTGLQPVHAVTLSYILYQDPASSATTIWATDGTRAGSRALSPLTAASAGVNADLIGGIGNRAVITFYNLATGNRDLWVTDGTDAGTHRVPNSSGEIVSVGPSVIANNTFYFMNSPTGAPVELWASDGTQAGTVLLAQIPNSVPDAAATPALVTLGNFLLFSAVTTDGGRELWRLDLTTHAVAQVLDIASGTASGLAGGPFWTVGNVVLFAASVTGDTNTTLWRTDGTPGGTFTIGTATPFTALGNVVAGGATSPVAIFIASGAAGSQLWGTDGTAGGTQLLSSNGGFNIYQIGGRFYFWSFATGSTQLWTTDGTTAGTHALAGLPSMPSLPQVTGTGNTLYLRLPTGVDNTGSVVRYDLASATTTVLTKYSGTTQPQYLIGVFGYAQGRLYFDNEDPVHGRELWTSDGTPAGTALLDNIAPETQTQSSNPADFVAFNGRLFFTAEDGLSGREVWYSDGTAGGTQQLLDINPGAAGPSPSDLFVANGSLFFFASDGTGTSYLWRSDGTTTGTQRLTAVMARPIVNRQPGCDSRGVAMGGAAYFAGYDPTNGVQLWRTDGTMAGTVRLTAPQAMSSPTACYLTVVGNLLYFQGTTAGLGTGTELWASDGTAAGTGQVADINPGSGSSSPQWLNAFGGALYFLAYDTPHGERLWSSTGTAAGTTSVVTLGSSVPYALQASQGGWLALTAAAQGGVLELWATNGTSSATTRVASNLTAPSVFVNKGLAFYAGLPTLDPWVSDGTISGTKLLLGINPTFSSAPDNGGNVTAGMSVTINVLANDQDPDGLLNPASVVIVTGPAHGTVTVSTAGVVTYTAATGYTGTDSFAYTVADDQGYVSAPATVTVDVVAPPPPAPHSGGGGSMAVADFLLLLVIALYRVSFLQRRRFRARR